MTDPFRYCVYCGVDCYVEGYEEGDDCDYAVDVEHNSDCPSVTGLYPVTEKTLGMRGPDDPYAHGMICMDCNSEFKLEDIYSLRPTDAADVFEVVCLGCRVLTLESNR